ncbi:MAG TPA: hypothetical protein VHE58_02710 [Burkholderiales bacterium]|nr:hypothetical protein [Burkholderiales bacterium]
MEEVKFWFVGTGGFGCPFCANQNLGLDCIALSVFSRVEGAQTPVASASGGNV